MAAPNPYFFVDIVFILSYFSSISTFNGYPQAAKRRLFSTQSIPP
jgi:hypothetical protein